MIMKKLDKIVSAGGKAIAVQANVTQKVEVERLFVKAL
jgi:3-oxoacyl-[acyl-carrier protein] reductase